MPQTKKYKWFAPRKDVDRFEKMNFTKATKPKPKLKNFDLQSENDYEDMNPRTHGKEG